MTAHTKSPAMIAALVLFAMLAAMLAAPARAADEDRLRIYLLTGQSNMQGHGYAFYQQGDAFNVPTVEFLADSTPAADNYRDNMPFEDFSFESYVDPSWLQPRDDVWAVQYHSASGNMERVEPTNDNSTWTTSIAPLSPGFGATGTPGSFGPELGMGHRLGDINDAPVFLFKSNTGGTTLAEDWRPPSAVAARGGTVGVNYTNTINRFTEFLDTLDADLGDDGMLNAYNNATSYEVAGFVWLQGWNEKFNNGVGEYADNIVDLVHDVRAADPRIPNNLGAIIPESTDQDTGLNARRAQAVATLNSEIPGSAVFFENNNMIGSDWGYNNDGVPFSNSQGYHFNRKAENYLEVGWRAANAAIEYGFLGGDIPPVPPGPKPPGIEIIVDIVTGEVFVDANTIDISGMQIHSPGVSMLPTDRTADVLQFVIQTSDETYAEGAFTDVPLQGLISLGIMYNVSIDARDLEFEYTMLQQPTFTGNVVYIPEPASLVLLGVVGLLALRRRRA